MSISDDPSIAHRTLKPNFCPYFPVTPSHSPLHHSTASPARQASHDLDAAGNAASSSSFMQKPQRGWLHPDRELRPGAGVSYGVRYIGALEVTKPMRTLDFEVRTQVSSSDSQVTLQISRMGSKPCISLKTFQAFLSRPMRALHSGL